MNDPIEKVLERAREAAGKMRVRISGGGDVIVQYFACPKVSTSGTSPSRS